MTSATHWIDTVDDLDIELLGMSEDELEAYAYAHAEPLMRFLCAALTVPY